MSPAGSPRIHEKPDICSIILSITRQRYLMIWNKSLTSSVCYSFFIRIKIISMIISWCEVHTARQQNSTSKYSLYLFNGFAIILWWCRSLINNLEHTRWAPSLTVKEMNRWQRYFLKLALFYVNMFYISYILVIW